MKILPNWASKGRGQWKYTGQKRPSFAKAPAENQESVWDYPRPPVLDHDSRTVVVKFRDTVLASTQKSIRVLETASPPTFYLPPSDVKTNYFEKSPKTTRCEWKGTAVYWNIVVDGAAAELAAWSYPEPFEEFQELAGYFSFYPSRVDCYVDGDKVKPQPGGFYGGWITPEIVGPVKGESPETYL